MSHNNTLNTCESRPQNVRDFEESSPAPVEAAVDSLEPWACTVELTQNQEPLYLGEGKRLYHPPSSRFGSGLAGTLEIDTDPLANETTVAFKPAGDPNEPSPLELVTELSISSHNRLTTLDELLPAIRSALTGEKCTSDRVHTSYDQWIKGSKKLRTFYEDAVSKDADIPRAFKPAMIQYPRIEHAICRYPLNARKVMGTVETVAQTKLDNGLHDINPEIFRNLLFAFASKNVDDTSSLTNVAGFDGGFNQ